MDANAEMGTRDRETIRFTMDMSPVTEARLQVLAHRLRASDLSAVLQKALALLDVAVEAKGNGERLYLSATSLDGPAREIVGL